MTIRLAREEDAEGILAIYSPFVVGTSVTFEEQPPAPKVMRERIRQISETYPWLVSVDEYGQISGYAYASRHRERPAYRWAVETSVYVREDRRRSGVAKLLYSELIRLLSRQGFYHAYAGITLPNDASIAFHEKMGFRPLAVYRKIGFKLAAWHDVGWWELDLKTPKGEPSAPIPVRELSGVEAR